MKWTEDESGAARPGLAWPGLAGVHMLHKMFTKDGAKSIHWGCCNNSCNHFARLSPPEQRCHILPFVFNWAAVQNYIFLLPRSFHPQKMSQLLISLLGIFPINFFLDRVQYNITFLLVILISMFCTAAISHRIWTWFCYFQRFSLRVYLRNQFTKTTFTLPLL